jgi:16S rRNA (uracil1498-N3)-methyltransferase
LPEVSEPVQLADALTIDSNHRYALDENPTAPPLAGALPPQRNSGDSVALLVGPEGGWTDEERGEFTAAGWRAVSLGPLILRAETAAIAALAVVSSAWPA